MTTTRSAKPQIDWDDEAAGGAGRLAGPRTPTPAWASSKARARPLVGQAASLLATVVGQDLEEGDDGVFRIARRVARTG